MRDYFNHLLIGKKLQLANLLVTSIVTFLTVIALSFFLYQSLISDYIKYSQNLAKVLAGSVDSALIFKDLNAARQALAGLKQSGNMEAAQLFDEDGKLFATYTRAAGDHPSPDTLTPSEHNETVRFGDKQLHVIQAVTDPNDEQKIIGSLLLHQNLNDVYQQLALQIAVLILISTLGFIFTSALLNRLQHIITRPLSELTEAMQRLSEHADFNQRAVISESHDEISKLGHTFNLLLENLGQRDDAKNEAQQRFETVLKAVPDLMFELSREGRYLNVWGLRGDLLFAPENELLGRTVSEILPVTAAHEVMSAIEEADNDTVRHSFGREICLSLAKGLCWFELSVSRQPASKKHPASFILLSRDITARKKSEDDIRNLAFYDVLTGLPNRRLLADRVQSALTTSVRSQYYGAVMFLDMDRFKNLNDTMGHDYGDMLLIEVANRMKSCVREIDTVARMGGDEFVILLEEIDLEPEAATRKAALIAEKVRAALAKPYRLDDTEQHSSPSIGVNMFHGDRTSLDVLFRHADMAMYQAKEAGRNTVRFFDPAMQLTIETRTALETELRLAIPAQQLQLHYQIQLDNELNPTGAEALVRWNHPKHGMVAPIHFITIAEESSLIFEIGAWVLDTACQQLARWSHKELTRSLTLSVNISALQFKKHDFVQKVETMLRIHEVSASRLKLELTESVVLENLTDVIPKMHALKALGIRLSLDDFGTGYSSLSYLKQLPLDQIKIDQSFVRDIAVDLNDAVMVKTIIDMANNFRLNVIAEGVETQAQINFLQRNGCMAYQGYFFGMPVPIEQFEALLTQ